MSIRKILLCYMILLHNCIDKFAEHPNQLFWNSSSCLIDKSCKYKNLEGCRNKDTVPAV